MSSEYATGLISTTFTTVPQCRSVLSAKAFAVGVTGWIAGTATALRRSAASPGESRRGP